MSESLDEWQVELRGELWGRIRDSERGQARMKLKTLLARFGYQASHRVRQSSLEQVLATLEDWGIAVAFVSGRQAHDWVTLTEATPSTSSEPPRPSEGAEPPLLRLSPEACLDPFAFVFQLDDRADRSRSEARARELVASVWACRPVCVFVTGSDEYFTFAAGYLAAVMRRRTLMLRGGYEGETLPLAPTILSGKRLASLRGEDEPHGSAFPEPGAVYLIHDDPDDLQDDELAAFIREVAIPHTYRAVARFDATSPAVGVAEARTASLDPRWPGVKTWLASYAGAPELAERIGRRSTDVVLGSLLVSAEQTRHAMLEQIASSRTDPGFRGGRESGEHLLLKSALATAFRRVYGERLLIEATVPPPPDDDEEAAPRAPKRPDVYVPGELWIEVETLRGLGRRGSDPFFALETKLRAKVRSMAECRQKWLVVPSDVAMLARDQICAVARNLSEDLGLALWDAQRNRLVALTSREPLEPVLELSGVPWTLRKAEVPTERLRWADVAGDRDLRQRLQHEVLEPFVDEARYARHGIGSPGGLLLYGLPGCGKSLIGRVLAGESDVDCRVVVPSDLTSMWLGEGVGRIRQLFDWARKRAPCVLVIDEIDGVAPARSEHNMHSDEKRQINELLVQLDKVAKDRVLVIATTNYMRGIDPAIRRAGRFDTKIAVFPPDRHDRAELFSHYLGRLRELDGVNAIEVGALAEEARLYTPADVRVVVEVAGRRALARSAGGTAPRLGQEELCEAIAGHARSIRPDEGWAWLREAQLELPGTDERLVGLERELIEVYGER